MLIAFLMVYATRIRYAHRLMHYSIPALTLINDKPDHYFSQACGQFTRLRASEPFAQYHIIPHDDRGTCLSVNNWPRVAKWSETGRKRNPQLLDDG